MSNDSLNKIGVDTITSLTEEAPGARMVNTRFDELLDSLTEAHPWNFAISRATLSRLAEAPAFEYTYQYQLPTSPYCLKVLSVYDEVSPWRVEGRKLLTDMEQVQIVYISRVTDLNSISPAFKEAFTYFLASEISVALTGENTLEKKMQDKASGWFKIAKMRDQKEGTPPDMAEVSWISRRR